MPDERAASIACAQPLLGEVFVCDRPRVLLIGKLVRADVFAFSAASSAGCTLRLCRPSVRQTLRVRSLSGEGVWAIARTSCLLGTGASGCVTLSAESTAGLYSLLVTGRACGKNFCRTALSGEMGVGGGCPRVLLIGKLVRADVFVFLQPVQRAA